MAGWGTGLLLTLYGGVGLGAGVLSELRVTAANDPDSRLWYLFLWDPVWLLGGALFVAAAYQFTRTDGRDPSTPLVR